MNLKIEILKIGTTFGTLGVEVTDIGTGESVKTSFSLDHPVHSALETCIKQAARALGEKRAHEALRAFGVAR